MRNSADTLLRSRLVRWIRLTLAVCLAVSAFTCLQVPCQAQANPLDDVETPTPPPPPKTEEEKKPIIEGADKVAAEATSHRNSRLRIDVNLVQIPMTVTDPMNRLVTGLEKENFVIYDNNVGQAIKYFSS
jgi:Ca-activated chloride channel family protein